VEDVGLRPEDHTARDVPAILYKSTSKPSRIVGAKSQAGQITQAGFTLGEVAHGLQTTLSPTFGFLGPAE
jgi:hypothetical protein